MNEFPLSKRALKGTIIKCVNDPALEQDANTYWGKKGATRKWNLEISFKK